MQKAWVLKDYRVGNANQAIALAASLNLDYKEKEVEYNFLAPLPNFLFSIKPWHIKNLNLLNLELKKDLPSIIISAGRRTAPLALYLKQQLACSKNIVKTIQIMRPSYKDDEFDYVILPEHDEYKDRKNTLRIIGALNNIDKKLQDAVDIKFFSSDGKKFAGGFSSEFSGEFTGIVIGGNTKKCHFTQGDNDKLIDLLKSFVASTKIPFAITFSRRTSASTKELIINHFPRSIIYDPYNPEYKHNIYLTILKSAKYIIATGDSISMCSEIAATCIPFFIFVPEQLKKSSKHISFINKLVDLKIARFFEQGYDISNYSYEPLNEIERLAAVIKL